MSAPTSLHVDGLCEFPCPTEMITNDKTESGRGLTIQQEILRSHHIWMLGTCTYTHPDVKKEFIGCPKPNKLERSELAT